MKLVVDVDNPYGPEVSFADLQLHGQWVEFYGLLALLRTEPARRDDFIDAERLHAMADWGTKKVESVRKEVSRHCKGLAARGLAVLDSQGKTKLWRLKIAPELIEFRPSRASVERWIRSHTRKTVLDEQWVEQLACLVAAQTALRTGEGENARELVRAISSFISPDLEAWAGLVDARATDYYVDALDNPDALDALADEFEKSGHAAGRSVGIRIRARIGIRKRILDPHEQYTQLGKIAADVERGGDIGALAPVLNTLGILATRTDQPDEAVHHHLRAAALFGISADYNSLQAAIFNVANARVKARQLAGELPDALCLRLLDLSLHVCDAFAVGKDSVQAEIAGVHWSMDIGDIEAARRYIDSGSRLVASLDSSFEQASFLLARARLGLGDAKSPHDVVRDLTAARRQFVALGVDEPLADIDAMLRRARKDR
ncbi:MAG: hypothetical protein AAGF11_15705 [Myxococcota bacterium]